MMLQLIARNAAEVRRTIEKADAARIKAARVAVRVEANRLRLAMKKEIKAGAPGGQPLTPLSIIARRTRDGRKPLERLAIPVRYWETVIGSTMHGGSMFSVGFNGGQVVGIGGTASKKNQVSKSWARIAGFQQAGGRVELTEARRQALISAGGRLKKLGWAGEARFYFLRKSTRSVTVPPRPIVDPFWSAHRPEAEQNIRDNYFRKLAGERL